ERAALLGRELERLRRVLADDVDALAPDLHAVVAGRCFNVVDVKTHGAAVAVEQETRKRCRDDQWIADRHVTSGAADLILRPGDGHDTRSAGEVRNVKHDLSGAVGFDRDNAGIKRERLLCGRRALQIRTRVATGLDLTARALHAIDNLT